MTTHPTKTITTRFTIISDTHTTTPFPSSDTTHAYRDPLPSADVLLHAGDLTKFGYINEHATTFDVIRQADAELKIVIAGNHDITLDEEYYATTGAKRMHRNIPESTAAVRDIWTGAKAREAGVVYLEEGTRTFTLKNGATFTIYTSPYTPEFCNWAFAYERHENRFNPGAPQAANPIPSHPEVDILLTHGPPHGILDSTLYGEKVGCEHLLHAVQRCRPRMHCFGHIHEGWGAELHNWVDGSRERLDVDKEAVVRDGYAGMDLIGGGGRGEGRGLKWGEETVFVNASVMDVRYRPVNAPWRVDLELPVKG